MDALNAAGRSERAYTTYMTVLTRLHRKGLLERRRNGKADIYTPRMSEDEYRQARAHSDVEGLLARYGEAAMVHFARELGRVDPDLRGRLERLARDDV